MAKEWKTSIVLADELHLAAAMVVSATPHVVERFYAGNSEEDSCIDFVGDYHITFDCTGTPCLVEEQGDGSFLYLPRLDGLEEIIEYLKDNY
jgi:hypothetical protein